MYIRPARSVLCFGSECCLEQRAHAAPAHVFASHRVRGGADRSKCGGAGLCRGELLEQTSASPCARRVSDCLKKGPCEMTLICKAATVCDLVDRQPGLQQQILRAINALAEQPLHWRRACRDLESARKMTAGKAADLCKLVETDPAVDMGEQHFLAAPFLPWRKRALFWLSGRYGWGERGVNAQEVGAEQVERLLDEELWGGLCMLRTAAQPTENVGSNRVFLGHGRHELYFACAVERLAGERLQTSIAQQYVGERRFIVDVPMAVPLGGHDTDTARAPGSCKSDSSGAPYARRRGAIVCRNNVDGERRNSIVQFGMQPPCRDQSLAFGDLRDPWWRPRYHAGTNFQRLALQGWQL